MVDAYQIGIELALQDDVSAGLQVIRQGLGEVDQAIAATSAGLTQLSQKAELAKQAVTASLSMQPTATPREGSRDEPVAAPTATNAAPSDAPQASPVPSAAGPTEPKVASDGVAPSEAPRAIAPAVEADVKDFTTATASVPEPRFRVTAPDNPTTSDDRLFPDMRPVPVEPALAPTEGFAAPTVPATVAPTVLNFLVSPAIQTGTSRNSPEQPRSPGSRVSPSVTATVREAMAPTSPGQTSGQPAFDYYVAPNARAFRDHATAPWSGIEQRKGGPGESAGPERAVAPDVQSSDREDEGGGTVMLDGQLVGYWLAEHMAREASRPPSGTTSFDPRQTPPWSVSGALS